MFLNFLSYQRNSFRNGTCWKSVDNGELFDSNVMLPGNADPATESRSSSNFTNDKKRCGSWCASKSKTTPAVDKQLTYLLCDFRFSRLFRLLVCDKKERVERFRIKATTTTKEADWSRKRTSIATAYTVDTCTNNKKKVCEFVKQRVSIQQVSVQSVICSSLVLLLQVVVDIAPKLNH